MINLAGMAVIGGISLLAFTKVFGTIFLGISRSDFAEKPSEVTLIMRIPQYIIVLLILLIGVFPMLIFQKTFGIVQSTFNLGSYSINENAFSLINNLAVIGRYSAALLLVTILLLIIRKLFIVRLSSAHLPTWGCGYVAPKSSMQYTSKSFSKTLGKLAGFIVPEKKRYIELTDPEIFPQHRKYHSHYNDFLESQIIDRITNWLNYFMNIFQFVQNGRTQMYILYGLFFIILVFIGTLFKII